MKNWLRSQSVLFFGVVLSVIIETVEIIRGSCAVWQQELMLLAIIGMMSLSIRNPRVSYLATIGLLGIYATEFYEQFIEFEICGFAASELNPLLVVALISAFSVMDMKEWKWYIKR
ncbi:MAG: hypothetical protein ACD_78C00240G0002 [uncultured bacterium (gcode 4)]|uniref:Uncharacterized protein n=1 Tax=uncultured bacterium (gcode 4) TaxID=1234023 RepID=K1YWZ2_9BACT|nr:MAG: hypothetical protein ACD_78C00240G0002 [uncultured bacterium (gcode 4)]HBB27590.1 hypothetical protein [Candidatus Gracilibacteria bacterium]